MASDNVELGGELDRIEEYEHHGRLVKVQRHLKGKHREHSLCGGEGCIKFKPNSPKNCRIAQAVFENCKRFGIVTPMWECPEFKDTPE